MNDFNFKGNLLSSSQLPTSGQQVNDTYLASRERAIYIWNGTGWDKKPMSDLWS